MALLTVAFIVIDAPSQTVMLGISTVTLIFGTTVIVAADGSDAPQPIPFAVAII